MFAGSGAIIKIASYKILSFSRWRVIRKSAGWPTNQEWHLIHADTVIEAEWADLPTQCAQGGYDLQDF